MDSSPSVSVLIEECLATEMKGDLAGARKLAHTALELAQAGGKPEEIAWAMVHVARVQHRLGHYKEALGIAQEALALAPHGSYAQVDALIMLGMTLAETERLSEAEDFYRRALDLSIEFGYPLQRYRILNNLAVAIYDARGQFDLAEASLQEALRMNRELVDDERLPYTWLAISWLYQFSGQRQKAHEALDAFARVAGKPLERGYHANLSALLALDEGRLEAALPLFAIARAAAEQIGEPRLNVEERLGMSRYHRLAGDPAAARSWAEEALLLTTRTGFSLLHGRALIERGLASRDIGDLPAAEQDFRAAMELLAPLEAAFDLARAAFYLAALLHREARPEALPTWQDAARRIISGGYAFLLEQERALAFPLVAAYLSGPDAETAALSETLLHHLERVPPPPLRIQTLGAFQVWRDSRLVSKQALRQRRAGELLALLLLAPGHRLAMEQAAEALLPEKPPETTKMAIYQATSELRRALEPELPDRHFPSRYLEVNETTISLHLPAGSWLDYEAFEQTVRSRDWEKALALYQGEFLPEYRYADWAAARRTRLEEDYHATLLALAEDRLASQRWQEALDFARQLIALDPWHEAAVLAAMRACQGLNDLSAARRYYKRLEKTLREDLGVEPQEELQSFFRSLKSQGV